MSPTEQLLLTIDNVRTLTFGSGVALPTIVEFEGAKAAARSLHHEAVMGLLSGHRVPDCAFLDL